MGEKTRPLRVLVVASSLARQNQEAAFCRIFAERGIQYDAIAESAFFEPYKSNILYRGFRKMCHRPFWRDLNRYHKEILNKARKLRPYLVIIFKGSYIFPWTITELQKEGALVFNWNMDDFFSLNRENYTSFLHASIPLYDAIFCTRPQNVHELRRAGARNVQYLPSAFDPAVHFPIAVSEEERKIYGSDIVFVGTYEKERAQMLEFLVIAGVYNVSIWGNLWERLPRRSPLRQYIRGRPIFCEEMNKVFCSSKIALAFLRKANRDVCVSRSFEIPATGSFMLAERSPEHMSLYEEGKEAAFFAATNPHELKAKIDYYLHHDEDRQRVARAGYERAMTLHCTIEDRLNTILDKYHELISAGMKW